MVTRYNFEQDTMEPAEDGTWVAYEDVAYLLEQRSLRDWFAGQALRGLINRSWDHLPTDADRIKLWAASAYVVADAMLAERSK